MPRLHLYFSLALLTMMCFACQQNKSVIEEVRGFWVHADTVQGRYLSLTIQDSIVRENSYGVRPSMFYLLSAREKTIDACWPFDGLQHAFHLLLRNDTLVRLEDSFYHKDSLVVTKYVRGDSVTMFPRLLCGDFGHLVQIKPKLENEPVENPFVPMRRSFVNKLLIGKVKPASLQNFTGILSDSIVIQTEDGVFFDLADYVGIDKYIGMIRKELDDTELDSLVFNLYVDRRVPDSYVAHVCKMIRRSGPKLRICQAVIDSNTRRTAFRRLP